MSLREELIQVAAVSLAIVRDLDTQSTQLPLDMQAAQEMHDVWVERHFQESKWGRQHHHIHSWLAILGEEVGEAFQAANDEVWPKAGIGGNDE